jgi:ketosteroid isomerase-like protein
MRHNGLSMSLESDVLAAERQFFAALIAADVQALERLLVEDFVLVDVMRGAEVSKADLVGALAAGQVRFDGIDASEARVRVYGDAAVVNGRTEMRLRFGENSAMVQSRYTHVFVRQAGEWRFVTGQGTPIAPE